MRACVRVRVCVGGWEREINRERVSVRENQLCLRRERETHKYNIFVDMNKETFDFCFANAKSGTNVFSYKSS